MADTESIPSSNEPAPNPARLRFRNIVESYMENRLPDSDIHPAYKRLGSPSNTPISQMTTVTPFTANEPIALAQDDATSDTDIDTQENNYL